MLVRTGGRHRLASEAAEPVSWQQAERSALDDYIEDRARDFVGRDAVLARLQALASSPVREAAAWGLVLTGAAGTGKSADLRRASPAA